MRTTANVIMVSVLALLAVGVVTIYSVGSVEAFRQSAWTDRDVTGPAIKHAMHAVLGLAALLAAWRFDYHWFRNRFVYYGLIVVTLGLLVAVLLIGKEVKGARRWIVIAGRPIQPSEFAKFVAIVILAVKLAENRPVIKSFLYGFLPPMLLVAPIMALILLENDLGTVLVIGAVTMGMLWVGGVAWPQLLGAAALGAGGVAAQIAVSEFRTQRILAFTDPFAHQDISAGFHLVQSFTAFMRGGVRGVGPGRGEQKLAYLPEANTDFIFPAWAEEMGLAGTLFVVLCFAALLLAGMRVVWRAPDVLGGLLAAGVLTLIVGQAALNMAVTTGLVPTTGLTLPFISHGGSSLLVNLGMVGVLLNVCSQCREEKQPASVLRKQAA